MLRFCEVLYLRDWELVSALGENALVEDLIGKGHLYMVYGLVVYEYLIWAS